jgi:predicted dehydrogenase
MQQFPGPIEAVMVGAGGRGHGIYGAWAIAHPDQLRFVAVADPDPARRARFGLKHAIPRDRWFPDSASLLAARLAARAAVVASPDRSHLDDARNLLRAGHHILLEKPMAASLDELEALVGEVRAGSGTLQVAHVLRHTPFFATLNRVVRSGRLGDIVTVEHRENVVSWHMAHSFVRGAWSVAELSTPMIVAKTCHDFDILGWNLASPVSRLASFGSLRHFRPSEAPAGAKERCTDGCPVERCPFDARRIYLDPEVTDWPVSALSDDISPEGRLEALRTGPYGRCVYTAGSNVVDHQVVAMELVDGASVTLQLHGHSHQEARTMRYDGTRATLRAVFGDEMSIVIHDHAGGTEVVDIPAAGGGHGGGDDSIMESFVTHVAQGTPVLTDALVSLESHLLAFSAEHARLTGSIVEMEPVRTRFGVGVTDR